MQNKTKPTKDVLSLVRPFVEELLIALGPNPEYALIITNKHGEILEIFGDEKAKANANSGHLIPGEDMNSETAGVTAISKALKEMCPVQIIGKEHNSINLQHLTCTAAPLTDENDKILGGICLTGPEFSINAHTFGLVVATAKAIENRLHNTTVQQQLFDAQQYAFSIINHLSFGLIAFNQQGETFWINDTACRALNIRRLKLINKPVARVYTDWRNLKNQIDKGEKIQDLEVNLITSESTEKFLLNAYAMFNQLDQNIGYVFTFRPLSRMLKLINKYANTQHNFTFDMIVYKSKAMQLIIDYAKTVANTPSTVLITGESGTGKEVFAQAIHNASDRRNQGFVAINCAAISSSLIESELFGYEEGAFTGALKNGRAGKIEIADQGTLFLDEIGEMPLEMQVKLLRVLQEKTVTRVGGHKEQAVDIRVIAATNKNLEHEIKSGNFREDLFYRLNVIPLKLLPLRDRRVDIPVLFQYFLSRKSNTLDRPIPKISVDNLTKITNYSWPGNVRELENFAEKTVIFDEKVFDMLLPEHEAIIQANTAKLVQFTEQEKPPTLEMIEKQVIKQYLETFGNNISKTAKALAIGRNTLYQKLQKYGLT